MPQEYRSIRRHLSVSLALALTGCAAGLLWAWGLGGDIVVFTMLGFFVAWLVAVIHGLAVHGRRGLWLLIGIPIVMFGLFAVWRAIGLILVSMGGR